MVILLFSLALFFAGGCAALASGRGITASRIGAGSAVAASLLGLAPAIRRLSQGGSAPSPGMEYLSVAKLPMGELALSMDLLSAIFLVPMLLLCAIAALYGMGNGDGSRGHDPSGGAAGGHAGAHWFFYNMLAGGMALTVTAADAFLFLLAWELMSLAPFFLITLADDTPTTRSAAWTYLVAAHLGALFLLGFFALLSARHDGSLAFTAFMAGTGKLDPGLTGTGLLFILALIGFGAKAGFMPLHVWLPEAHPAAPSHVSAVMSGAMINMGVYGIIRALMFLGAGDAWWAYALIGIGAFTGFAGIMQALAQPAIKRSLAFSSVENIGIICMALGIALLCLRHGHTEAAALAATGGLVHLVNHALSKGLLFLCAGCVLHGAGTVTLRLLGGLQKRMPVVGWCFALGAAAISALPPLNGFAGEFFIYLAMIFGGAAFSQGFSPELSLVLWISLFTLAGIGGFTLLCFARLYGAAFLGEPRSNAGASAQGPGKNEVLAMALLAMLCIGSAMAAPRVASVCHAALAPALYEQGGRAPSLEAAPAREPVRAMRYAPASLHAPRMIPAAAPDSAITLLGKVNDVFLLFIVFFLAAFLLRRRLLRGREIASSLTWDCGYIAPTARMQYTAGSFSRPAAWFMRTLLRQKVELPRITDYFPIKAEASLETRDWIETKGFVPLFTFVRRMADMCKHLQHGQANGYILYILITLVALLAWEFSR